MVVLVDELVLVQNAKLMISLEARVCLKPEIDWYVAAPRACLQHHRVLTCARSAERLHNHFCEHVTPTAERALACQPCPTSVTC